MPFEDSNSSEIYQEFTIIKFCVLRMPCEKLIFFGLPEVDPKLPKKRNSQIVILCFIVDIGTMLAKVHSSFNRYWSHIHDF